ncbi:MAG: methyltransferase [bacterium]
MTNDDAARARDVSPSWQMTQLIWSAMRVQAVSVAAQLGIADRIVDAPMSAVELATATRTHAPTLLRLLRALTTLGIFAENAEGRFANTTLSETLRDEHPASVRSLAMLWGLKMFWSPWNELRASVTTGERAFDKVFGEPFFDRLAHEPEDASIFNGAMASFSDLELSSLLAAYDFSRFERLVDVGGGRGALLNGILRATPALHGVLYDLPEVVGNSTSLLIDASSPQCDVVAGSFFDSVPAGADGYVLKRIIHDWNDDDALKILVNCRNAIRDDGTLLIIDWVLRPPNEPDVGKFMDLHMLVLLGGRERTEVEWRALLARAGFSLTRVIATNGPHSIIECRPDTVHNTSP